MEKEFHEEGELNKWKTKTCWCVHNNIIMSYMFIWYLCHTWLYDDSNIIHVNMMIILYISLWWLFYTC